MVRATAGPSTAFVARAGANFAQDDNLGQAGRVVGCMRS